MPGEPGNLGDEPGHWVRPEGSLCRERVEPQMGHWAAGEPSPAVLRTRSHTLTCTQSFLLEMASLLSISHGVSQDPFSAHFSVPFVLSLSDCICAQSVYHLMTLESMS